MTTKPVLSPEAADALRTVTLERDQLKAKTKQQDRRLTFIEVAIREERWLDPSAAAQLALSLHDDATEALKIVALKSGYLLKPTTNGPNTQDVDERKKLSAYFGPRSDSRRANDLAQREPETYKMLKARARELDLIG